MAGLKNLDKWREYFRSCFNSDIFDIIEHALYVAASDCPKELKLRRDRIAETLFSSKLIKCVGCDHVELGVKLDGVDDDEEFKRDDGFEFEGGRSKESKVDSCRDDQDDDGDDQHHHVGEMNNQMVSQVSYDEAEALTDEIEKEKQILNEVSRIKAILENSEDEPISLLIDSLRRLELMVLSVEILKATEIGLTVNVLRKHGSKDIRQLARTLIEGWKVLVDEWVNSTAADAGAPEGATPESVNPSTVVDEENGLPSPPLDDLAFLSTQPTTMEFSQFFDGLEDEENPAHCSKLDENKETGRKQAQNNRTVKQRSHLPVESITTPKDKKNEQTGKPDASKNKQVAPLKPKLPVAETRVAKPAKPSVDQRVHTETKFQQKPEKVAIQRPPMPQQKISRHSDEDSVQVKLEATKRKLQERYQQAENAKRQRTIQVMELHDLPKQDVGHKNSHGKPGNNHKRHWANGRR